MFKILLIVFLTVSFTTNKSVAQIQDLSAVEFDKKLAATHPQLLDVRTAQEFKNGFIKNALQADWKNGSEFAERIRFLDKSQPLFVYCTSGIRSSEAAKWLLENGFSNISTLNGGTIAWRNAGKPLTGIAETDQLTAASYFDSIQKSGPVLVDFGAEWCPPCKKMEPVLLQLQNDLTNRFQLIKVDAGIHTEIMKELKVTSIPTFIIYKNGKETWRREGIATLQELKDRLDN